MVKSWHRTLARKILFLFAISFLFSLFLFLLLHSAGATVLKGYFHSSEFIYNAEASYIKEFSEFVEQNEVSAKDTAQLFQWKKDNKIRYMTVLIQMEPFSTMPNFMNGIVTGSISIL